MKKILLSGNDAIAKGAMDSGCRFYAGYPITPQNELTAYMGLHMPQEKGVFIQAESEVAAINMVFGASAAGALAMTSSSSPGISLKQEGISYIAGAELPAVIVNIMRGGPGLGNIWPAQSDYWQATRGGGHGDYHCLVLAPSSVQEAYDFMFKAFSLADQYRNPVMILGDGMLGQMMEPVSVLEAKNRKPSTENRAPKTWALTGCRGRNPNIVKSFYLHPGELEKFNLELQIKYTKIVKNEQQFESLYLDDAEIILVAYGTMARIVKDALKKLRLAGYKVGLIRPITLWPFPKNIFNSLTRKPVNSLTFLAIEMSYGQMVDDVSLAVNGRSPVEFIGRSGGGILSVGEIIKKVKSIVNK